MKKHQQTDRIIKEKMEQYSMDTPMHLFAGIAEALDGEAASASVEQKKSWRNGYWILTLLALVVGGSGVWFLTSNEKTSRKGETEMSITLNSNNNAETDFEKNERLEKTSVANRIEEISKSETTNAINANNQLVQEELKTNLSKIKKPIISSPVKNNVEKSDNSIIYQSTKNPSFKTTTPENILTQKGGTSGIDNNINPSVSNQSNEQNNITKMDVSSEGKPIASTTSKNLLTGEKATKDVFNLPKLDQLASSSINHSRPYQLAVEPTCGLKPDGSKVRFTTSLDVFFSPDYANQMLEYKSEDFREHAELRTKTEKPYYSFNTGVRVNFLTEFGWAIRTGIVYTQINEILETQYTEIVTTLDPNGNVIGTTEGIREVDIRNKYKMIDIPFIFGYEVPMKKFDLNVNGGVYMNLMSKQSGAFFSPIEDRVVYFTEGHPDNYDIFKNNIGLSIFMGLGFNFDLTTAFNADKKTQLIVEPHARFYPKSFALDNYILNQKYLSTGVMIGLRRDL